MNLERSKIVTDLNKINKIETKLNKIDENLDQIEYKPRDTVMCHNADLTCGQLFKIKKN